MKLLSSVLLTTVLTLTASAAFAQARKVVVDGSSTVAPISIAIAEGFMKSPQGQGVQVSVATSGTGGGFKKFCAGETDISNASRPIRDSEIEACKKNGINFVELPIAFDGLTIVTNKANDWATCLTLDQVKKAWGEAAEGTITNWNQIDPKFPNVPLVLFGAGTDSGTFDYFKEVVGGGKGDVRADFTPSEDDNVIVTGVAGSRSAMGFFGLAYYEENTDKLNAVAIDAGDGCVAPSPETVQNGTYRPFSRPLFIYVRSTAIARPEVKAFVEYYLNDKGATAAKVGYIALPEQVYTTAMNRFRNVVTGSIFKDLKPGTPIGEVFK